MGDTNLLNELKSDDMPECPGGRTVNVAAQMTLGLKELNMRALVLIKDLGFGQNQKRFVAGMIRIRVDPPHWYGEEKPVPQDVTALIYHTANVVLTGAPNEYMARSAAWALMHMLRREGIPARMFNFQVENIVTKFALGFRVDLQAFKNEMGDLVTYEPEKFPAAIYCDNTSSTHDVNLTVLVNYTGSLVITGSKNRYDSIAQYKRLYNILMRFKVTDGEMCYKPIAHGEPDKWKLNNALEIMGSLDDSADWKGNVMKKLGLGNAEQNGENSGEDNETHDLEDSYVIRLPVMDDSSMKRKRLTHSSREKMPIDYCPSPAPNAKRKRAS